MQVLPRGHLGMSTGRASRASVLTSACLRACGASPRHSASFGRRSPCARSSKRAGGFIPRIALDECRDPERYRTRASFSRVWFNSRMRPCQDRDDGATPFTRSTCPCGVVQPTRLPLMQEITGAKPVRDANFTPPKHCQRCARSVSESARCNSGWGLHSRSRASAQVGFISPLRPGQHRGLRPNFAC